MVSTFSFFGYTIPLGRFSDPFTCGQLQHITFPILDLVYFSLKCA